uniref:PEGA domain-containing protein n=1 Tax=uncultured bacterium contig00104 TaxID=1181571 RepID=A0A806KLL1_9BACT|nr:hypothetical protein [uncultured bacterium contig00104]
MKKILLMILIACFASFAQVKQTVAIVDSESGDDRISDKQLEDLTSEVREIAHKVFEGKNIVVLSKAEFIRRVGGGNIKNYVKECKESNCLADLGKKGKADYVAQAVIRSNRNNELEVIVEVYKTNYGVEGGVGNLQIGEGYKMDGKGTRYIVNITIDPPEADLSIGGEPVSCEKMPCKHTIAEGNAPMTVSLDQYETKDTVVKVSQNNQNISMKLKPNFGVLTVNPAFSDYIGSNSPWNLSLNNKNFSIFENRPFETRLQRNRYKGKITHECYEDVNFDIGIEIGKSEKFDMSDKLVLKSGGLVLEAERNGEPVVEPIFINGKRAGETPFSKEVPICSRIEIGNDRDVVNVQLKYKEDVKYIHTYDIPTDITQMDIPTDTGQRDIPTNISQSETKNSSKSAAAFWTALALDALGAGFVIYGVTQHFAAKKAHDDYMDMKSGTAEEFESAWKKVEDAKSNRTLFYVIGGVSLGLGIGVHIAF